jgi:outer membrane protein TolC
MKARKQLLITLLTAMLPVGVFLAAAPCHAQDQQPYRLTIKDAIERGLKANLSVLVSGTRIAEAEGTRERRLSGLLPHARIEIPATVQTRSLKTQGISFPGAPDAVGPFSTYDFRGYADQSLFDRQLYHIWKASDRQLQATRDDYQDVRNLIIRQIAGLYLSAESAAAQVTAAESRVTNSQALFHLASDQHDVGKATGVDVLRAQVQLTNDRQSLLEARNSAREALLVLARNIGLSLGTPVELAETLRFQPLESPQITVALEAALAGRADYQSLMEQRASLVEQNKASRARYLPRLGVIGNYGGTGRSLGGVVGTGQIQGTLTFTLFDRDREGEQKEIASRLQGIDQQIADLRLGIEEEIRVAALDLESAADEVTVAQAGLGLAERELALASDRFQNGITNNIEVVNAQDAFARAQQNSIVALTRHADAKMSLARALGDTEKIYAPFLGIQ